jgi:hypothetical protein
MSDWPGCNNCYSDENGACGYVPSRPWITTTPADIDRFGCCGYWHSETGETRRERCRIVNDEIQWTHPPVDIPLPTTSKETS